MKNRTLPVAALLGRWGCLTGGWPTETPTQEAVSPWEVGEVIGCKFVHIYINI